MKEAAEQVNVHMYDHSRKKKCVLWSVKMKYSFIVLSNRAADDAQHLDAATSHEHPYLVYSFRPIYHFGALVELASVS